MGGGRNPRARRRLRTHTAEDRLPQALPQPAWLPARLLAGRLVRSARNGREARCLVCRMLLGAHGVAFCPRGDEHRVDGVRRGSDRRGEGTSVGPRSHLRYCRDPARARCSPCRRAPCDPGHDHPGPGPGGPDGQHALTYAKNCLATFWIPCSAALRTPRHALLELRTRRWPPGVIESGEASRWTPRTQGDPRVTSKPEVRLSTAEVT